MILLEPNLILGASKLVLSEGGDIPGEGILVFGAGDHNRCFIQSMYYNDSINFCIFERKMPTILLIAGWRLYFWANENNEPIHIHAEKGDMECKFFIDVENFEITSALEYNLTPQAKREIKKIIYDHLDYIDSEWKKFFIKK